MNPDTGFYCEMQALTKAERARYDSLRQKLQNAAVEIKELENGYAVRLQTATVSLVEIAEWVASERKCCPFFDFQISAQQDAGPVWLSLTGGNGVKQFIRQEFGYD
jgi:hypothetical protein